MRGCSVDGGRGRGGGEGSDVEGGDVEGGDASVRHRRPDEGQMDGPGEIEVADIRATSREELGILPPEHSIAENANAGTVPLGGTAGA